MKKTNKIASALLSAAMLMGLMMSAVCAEGNICDPFNNDLFTVEKEIVFEDGFLPGSMESYSTLPNEDYSAAKIVKESYNENGEKVITELTDFLSDEEFNKKYDEIVGGASYNDGLKEVRVEDEGFVGFSFIDNNNNEIFFGYREQGADVGYNIGILRDAYGSMNMDTYEYDITTTFSNIMTNKAQYTFEANFTDFGDNGCAIMEKEGKFYLVKLKNGVIPTVFYNGEKIKFDQIPVIEEGRTLVPLRAIFEKIGATVDWNGDTQTVVATKDDVTVSLTIDNTTATKNGEAINLDVPAKIIGGRTLVPVRFISDCFGVDVQWDGIMQRVSLTK